MYSLIPLSLYVHFPWCFKKCPYCDFNSYGINKKIPNINYVKHLLNDLDNNIPLIYGRKINSIFIGGGSPNLLSANAIKILINGIMDRLYIKENIEITIEINPEKKINIEKFITYQQIGINRISIGVQSFCINNLKSIGRFHTIDQSKNIIQFIKNLKINNINLDLMYGLPNQSIKNALNDIKEAIKINPSHISWYQMTIEPNTLFYKKKPVLPNDNIMWNIFKEGHKLLTSSGYKKYEVSSYAKSSKLFCFHNVNYWNFGDYLGIGCGSHSKITQKNYKIIRMIKTRHPNLFMKGKYLHKSYNINSIDRQLEFFMNRFRLNKPIKKSDFKFYTGLSQEVIHEKILKSISKKYVIDNDTEWKITKKGQLFLNDLLEIFL